MARHMTERQIQRPEGPPPKSRWPVDAIAQALAAETELVQDIFHGTGVRYHVGLSETIVDTWERDSYIRVRGQRDEIASSDMEPLIIDELGVQFHGTRDHRKWVIVNRDGQTFLHIPPSSPAERYQYPEAQSAASPPEPLLPAQAATSEALSEVPDANEAPVPEGPFQAFPAPPAEEQRERANKVEVMGNIAWEPKYREFQSGNVRLSFDVAVHPEPDKTVYYHVKAFGDRARRYKDQFHRGQTVHVVGGRAYETVKVKGKDQERMFIILWGMNVPGAGKP